MKTAKPTRHRGAVALSSFHLPPFYFSRLAFFLLTSSFLLLLPLPLIAQSIKEANSLIQESIPLWDQGKYREALPLYERAFALYEKALGPLHPHTAITLKNIAFLHQHLGNYNKAKSLFQQCLSISEKTNGPQSPDTAILLIEIADINLNLDDLNINDNISLCNKAIYILEKKLGAGHELYAKALLSLGRQYVYICDYSSALQLYERGYKILEKALGPMHQDTASTLDALSGIYMNCGDFSKALLLAERVLDVRESDRAQRFLKAAALNNIATIYFRSGNYEKSNLFYEKSLILSEKKLGTDHPDVAFILNNFATSLMKAGNISKALPLLLRAQLIYEKFNGASSRELAVNQRSIGEAYQGMGEYSEAFSISERALQIIEKEYGQEHPVTADTLGKLALLTYCMDDYFSANQYAVRQSTILKKLMELNLRLDEKSRLFLQEDNLAFWAACVLSSDSLAEHILNQKGIVLDSLAEDRALALAAGASGEGGAILQNIKFLQSRLSKIAFEKDKEMEAAKMQDEIGRFQRELTSKYLGRDRQRFSAGLTMADIVPSLAGGGVLVDFISFNDPKLKGEEAACLGAIITAEDNKPAFVRIDGAVAINRSIKALRTAINQGNAAEVEAQTKFLSEKLWQPVAAKIPLGTKHLYLCPDASLNFLSFAALLGSEGRFVAEDYAISYIGSARDLARKPKGKVPKTLAVLANPMFDATGFSLNTQDMLAMRSVEADLFGTIQLPPLPGTEAEASALEALATESGWKTRVALGKNATESGVRKTRQPGILHLATHGFYLNSYSPPAPEGSRGMSIAPTEVDTPQPNKQRVDPMRASGLALSGAKQTLDSWSRRKAPSPENDGILTAEEVGALRLDGTWLVVLSACETGVGEARSGEGVFGLRRAFMIAGAENLLMTLWPVADQTTAKIMTDFYKEALATGDAAGSLAKVQRDWLVKLRNERGLLAAVAEAGPFALVVMTNPNSKPEFEEADFIQVATVPLGPKSPKILEFTTAQAKADLGDARAQAVLSIYYGLGLGCVPDAEKSKEYAMLSAKQKNALGIFRLAEMRDSGDAMDQNSTQANQLMQKAKTGLQAMGNDPYALMALATIHEREDPSSPKIRQLLEKACALGYEPAAEKLSNIEASKY